MKFKVIGHTNEYDCILKGVDISEEDAEKNNIITGSSFNYRADLLVSGDLNIDKNLSNQEVFENILKDKIVYIERFTPFLLLAHGVKILDEW